MSFSGEVKEELSGYLPAARHCQIAELAAIFGMCGQIQREKSGLWVRIHTENIAVARKYFTLLQKTFNIKADMCVRRNAYLKKSRTYIIVITNQDEVQRFLEALKIEDETGNLTENKKITDQRILQSSCCRRAFIRGAFLASGSISDPEKFYHLEIVCTSQEKAEQMRQIINSFPVEAKIVRRKKYHVVYIKEGEQIGEMLRIMEASMAVMNLENIRIVKEMRNSINRQVNCETANIHKTVSAAIEQINDIKYIREYVGFDNLPENLREIALARLEKPEATLKELGDSLTPPVGKSGVNHRLRKLKMIADKSREKKEEDL
ncbi:MAG TPA: DNA-binding protein WhiA [Candidatus Fimimorpha excrementavium]|nr:DNA-binding protein WhiA [Candidatus Fimimorpha excrementavium]